MPSIGAVIAANAAAPRRDGQQALVLGGTSGIGAGVAVRTVAVEDEKPRVSICFHHPIPVLAGLRRLVGVQAPED